MSIAYSPDGRLVASGCRDGSITVRDVESGRKRYGIVAHSGGVRSVAFNRQSTRLASSGGDYTIRIWDVVQGRKVLDVSPKGGAGVSMTFSPDGRCIASWGSERTIRIWDALGGGRVLDIVGLDEPVSCLAYSSDGYCLASGSHDETIRLWDSSTCRELLKYQGQQGIADIGFSPDGNVIAAGEWGGGVVVMEVATGSVVARWLAHGADVTSLCFSPNGRLIATGSKDGTVLLWNLASIEGADDSVRPASDLDELWMALAGQDARKAYAAIWAMAAMPTKSTMYVDQQLEFRPPDLRRIQSLMAALDCDDLAQRSEAAEDLLKLPCETILVRALSEPSSLEQQARMLAVLNE